MPLHKFEDIATGSTFLAGPIQVTREAIIAFAQTYDPQLFHLDELAAKDSLLGGLAASGWHTTAIGMRLYYDGFVQHVASMGAPGVDEVRWLRPVRPGDELSLVLTVGDKRVSASKPDRGFIAMALDIRNGADETVMTQRCPIIVERRGTTQAVRPPPPVAQASGAVSSDADLMLAGTLDEVAIGHESIFGSQLFTPEIIKSFAATYDPQYFHTDPDAAAKSHFGGLIASGWQTAAFWMKHYIAARQRSTEARQAAGLPIAIGGPSPGFANMKWHCPTHVGDTITYAMKITGKRATRRAGWALITTENTGRTADGTLAFSFDGKLLWPTG